VILLVACWCSGMGFLLARLLPNTQLAGSSLAILVALGACLNGVFPTLRELHSTPWFLISGEDFWYFSELRFEKIVSNHFMKPAC